MRTIEYIDINDIRPYENNPRINSDTISMVAESIKKYGFRVPLALDKNNVIVTGHTRYEACKLLGLNPLPCIRLLDLTDEQIKAYRLTDNKVAEFSVWDTNLLKEELASLKDLNIFGFDLDNDEVIDIDALKNEYFDAVTPPKYVCPHCGHIAQKDMFKK